MTDLDPIPTAGTTADRAEGDRVNTAFKYVGAYLVSLIVIGWIASTGNQLPGFEEMVGAGRTETAPTGSWVTANVAFVGALLLWAGRRRDRIAPWVDHRQLYGVVWMGWWILMLGAFFLDPAPFGRARECGDAGCWPTTGVVTSLVFSPALAAMVVMVIQAFLPGSWPWWRRASPAVIVFALATGAQLLLWPDVLQPIIWADP
jgi:hypothetical protein